MIAKLRNGGQSCVAANRILVQEGIAAEFVARFQQAMAAVEVGPGTQAGVAIGPLIDDRAVKKCSELVTDAVVRGAQLVTGGDPLPMPGHFYPPTVLDQVPAGARILDEEIFGPVAPIVRFGTEAEAVALANATPYGLAAYVFTENLDRALRVSDALETGMVGINQGVVSNVAAPFGGVKHSGLGREGGHEGIEEYLETKYLAVNKYRQLPLLAPMSEVAGRRWRNPVSRQDSVAVIAGDGIGHEVVPAAMDVVDAVGARHGFSVGWNPYPWGSDHYRAHGTMMPADGLDQLARHEAVFFGAVGAPDIADHITLWGLLIPIRRGIQQYVNLRPARYVKGVRSPLADPDGTDLMIVRENVEGEYSEVGGRFGRGTDAELAVQEAVFTRRGTARVAEYAAGLAARRSGKLTSATKSNGIIHSMPFWDEVVAEAVAKQPRVELRSVLIDALAAAMVSRPQQFDVIVASNLFGDILSDLAAACVGSIGVAASGNLNPERTYPSMFEPVHGSAPDIAGRGIANPIGQISTAALMLDFLGETKAAADLNQAVDAVLTDGPRTPDLGGQHGTRDVADAIREQLI